MVSGRNFWEEKKKKKKHLGNFDFKIVQFIEKKALKSQQTMWRGFYEKLVDTIKNTLEKNRLKS